jgi:hypothetical protein
MSGHLDPIMGESKKRVVRADFLLAVRSVYASSQSCARQLARDTHRAEDARTAGAAHLGRQHRAHAPVLLL